MTRLQLPVQEHLVCTCMGYFQLLNGEKAFLAISYRTDNKMPGQYLPRRTTVKWSISNGSLTRFCNHIKGYDTKIGPNFSIHRSFLKKERPTLKIANCQLATMEEYGNISCGKLDASFFNR